MIFTGRNLELVRDGLRYALAELHNRIATCPNVFDPVYAEAIEELEEMQKDVFKLLTRIYAKHPELDDGEDDAC